MRDPRYPHIPEDALRNCVGLSEIDLKRLDEVWRLFSNWTPEQEAAWEKHLDERFGPDEEP
jgi:hypothetical protein